MLLPTKVRLILEILRYIPTYSSRKPRFMKSAPYLTRYCLRHLTWILHDGDISRVAGHLCGEFPGPRWIPRTQRPVTRSFDVFFDLRLNKQLSKQSWGWWFETLPRPLWRQRNDKEHNSIKCIICETVNHLSFSPLLHFCFVLCLCDVTPHWAYTFCDITAVCKVTQKSKLITWRKL